MVEADLERWTKWQNGEKFPWDAPYYINEEKSLLRKPNQKIVLVQIPLNSLF